MNKQKFYLAKRFIVLLLLTCLLLSSPLHAQEKDRIEEVKPSTAMTQADMEAIIAEFVGEYSGSGKNIQFTYNDVLMALISDADHNRMRIIAPITNVTELTDDHINGAMVANFHLALDARYAISNGVLYAAYIHPLKELTKQQLTSAVRQVASLKATFGSTYTSGELRYGGRNPEEQDI